MRNELLLLQLLPNIYRMDQLQVSRLHLWYLEIGFEWNGVLPVAYVG